MERVEHGWGHEMVLWKTKEFTVKLIHIDYNNDVEIHRHLYKRELVIDEGLNTYLVEPGQAHTLSCDKDKRYREFIEVSVNESQFDKINVDLHENHQDDT